MKNIKASVIYVNYKSFDELKKSISSIEKYKPKVNYEIVVIDNEGNSKLEKYIKSKKNSIYIKSPKNLGYAAGNNLGAKYAKGNYLLILNPDTLLASNIIDQLASYLDKNKDTAIAAPILINSDGKFIQQISPKKPTPPKHIFTYTFLAKLFPKNWIRREFLKESTKSKKPYQVEIVPGSAFMIRKSVFENVGMFDENLFLYFEENDLGIRLKEKGYKLFKIPDSKIIHDWNPAEGNKKTKKIFEKSRFYYFKKHYGLVNAVIVELFSRKWWKFS